MNRTQKKKNSTKLLLKFTKIGPWKQMDGPLDGSPANIITIFNSKIKQ